MLLTQLVVSGNMGPPAAHSLTRSWGNSHHDHPDIRALWSQRASAVGADRRDQLFNGSNSGTCVIQPLHNSLSTNEPAVECAAGTARLSYHRVFGMPPGYRPIRVS